MVTYHLNVAGVAQPFKNSLVVWCPPLSCLFLEEHSEA